MHAGYTVPGVVTGKPVGLGGSEGRADATGLGVMFTAERALAEIGISMRGATVAVQGFGNVGEAAARLIHERGARIVAVTDVGGGVTNPDGLDPVALKRHLSDETGIDRRRAGHRSYRQRRAPGARRATSSSWPPSRAGHIAQRRCGARPRHRRGRQRPGDPDADPILAERGIVTVPDILCNAGGVIVSYFEWVQNLQSFAWPAAQVAERLEQVIGRAYDEVSDVRRAEGTDARLAAHLIAVKRVAEAQQIRGQYP